MKKNKLFKQNNDCLNSITCVYQKYGPKRKSVNCRLTFDYWDGGGDRSKYIGLTTLSLELLWLVRDKGLDRETSLMTLSYFVLQFCHTELKPTMILFPLINRCFTTNPTLLSLHAFMPLSPSHRDPDLVQAPQLEPESKSKCIFYSSNPQQSRKQAEARY